MPNLVSIQRPTWMLPRALWRLAPYSTATSCWKPILRKEVIQPHLPIRLPCYDFVPLTPHTFGGWLLAVTPPTSGADNSGDVTGGVYKARERIQRSLADLRLLAIPASRRRVAAYDPN
jgi:hypothetical protein